MSTGTVNSVAGRYWVWKLASLSLASILLAGCAVRAPSDSLASEIGGPSVAPIAPGVVYRAISTGIDAGVDLVDVDLATSHARPALVTGKIHTGFGVAKTPEDWLADSKALAAVNGGYFGEEDSEGREQVMGLLVRNGKTISPAPALVGQGGNALAPGQYVRSAFGITHSGMPVITWAATSPNLRRYDAPIVAHARSSRWVIWNAVGCGPTLIQNARIVDTDRLERLASSGERPRTFVAYDDPEGMPQHFLVGTASSMTFAALARFIQSYFQRTDHTSAEAAMCLDGGESSQLSYRSQDGVQSPLYTGVEVPDAILVRR